MINQPIHVVILDDDLSIRTALLRLLKSAEMVAHAYATSHELLESLALKRPDCLLLDLEGPQFNGLDVLKHLNQQQFRTPTIVVTGSDKDSRETCIKAGAVAYLRKPLDSNQLLRMIEEIAGADQPVANAAGS